MATTERFSLKDHLFNEPKVQALAKRIAAVHPEFDAKRFIRAVVAGFPERELMDRARHITAVLGTQLPADYRTAVGILLRSLPPALDPTLTDGDFGDFIYLPFGYYVAEHGLGPSDLAFSLAALREITTRFSMEFPLRPFLVEYPEDTLATLRTWVDDEHYHVRRLVSEGTRPFLPWAPRVNLAPPDTIGLLDSLHTDPTRYVTRSVANHLNDLAKRDPELVIGTLTSWRQRGEQRERELAFMTRHALRTLVKDGHLGALSVLGFETPEIRVSDFRLSPATVRLGGGVGFECTVTSASRRSQRLLIDYVLWFRKANGALAPKTHKLTRLELAPGESVEVRKQHPLRPMTTRTLHPGTHRIELQINGHKFDSSEFELVL
jgi:3-methyladenine DNA glycosylase AlkC